MRPTADRGNVENTANAGARALQSGTPLAVAAIVGSALAFLIFTRRAFKGSVVTF